MKILCVDDSESFVEVFRIIGKLTDHNIETAMDGMSALIKMEHHKFDAIFLDLEMSPMSGKQFLAVLQERGDKTPVAVLSASLEEDEEIKAFPNVRSYWLKQELRNHFDSMKSAINGIIEKTIV